MNVSDSPEARARLAVLAAVARRPELWSYYVLKGGLALRLAYGSPRRTHDLDFSALAPVTNRVTTQKNRRLETFCDQLDVGLAEVAPRYGFARMAVTHRSLSEEIPVILTEVGYAEAGEAAEGWPHTVEMQAGLSEHICETREAEYDGLPLHVPTLDDALAEKLKSLIQQPVRETVRSTDVFDLWHFLARSDCAVDPERITDFLLRKSAPWPSIRPVTRARFHDPAVRRRARAEYDDIRHQVDPGAEVPPFDEAFDRVLTLVDRLELPTPR